jgi:uncharacterized zinc-type alcohol dehydrogenase-like protein
LGNSKESGCFGEVVRINHKWAFHIPENLSSQEAAPLLCAGITVYSPIRDYFKPGMCVGVSGIGGLGHLALSFARAFGAEVVAFSTSPEKEHDAKSLGAHHFVCINNNVQTAKFQGRVDLLLVTSCTSMDWRKEMSLLAPDGVLCLIGIPPEGTMVSDAIADLVFSQKKIVGSIVGGRQYMREMLRMASLQNIRPKVTVLPFSQVNEAIKLLEEGKMNHNFRIVLSREEN